VLIPPNDKSELSSSQRTYFLLINRLSNYILIHSVHSNGANERRKESNLSLRFVKSLKFQNLNCSIRLNLDKLWVAAWCLWCWRWKCWQLSRNEAQNIFNRLGYFTINQNMFLLDRLSHSKQNNIRRRRKSKQTNETEKLIHKSYLE
jgi:hypothetical protein